jgi:hypothetical protein
MYLTFVPIHPASETFQDHTHPEFSRTGTVGIMLVVTFSSLTTDNPRTQKIPAEDGPGRAMHACVFHQSSAILDVAVILCPKSDDIENSRKCRRRDGAEAVRNLTCHV